MAGRIRVRKHEAIPDCGSFEVQVPGKGSTFFYWDDIAGRRLRPEMTREQALEAAKARWRGLSGMVSVPSNLRAMGGVHRLHRRTEIDQL